VNRFLDGTQPLAVQVQDSAGNVAESPPITVRIDNTPPSRIDVGVDGGEAWRNRNEFLAQWTNPPEPDRAPIAGATYRLCAASSVNCSLAAEPGGDISRVSIQVPAPGEWTLSLWRRDAAGNETEAAASVPVTLRYDPEPPQLGFEASSTTDPTLVSVPVTDAVSGLAGGTIEMSPIGSATWQALPTQKDGSRLLARIDDAALPAGAYQLRVRAVDHAGNEASTDRRLDGQLMSLTLPLRIESRMRAGFLRVRTVRRRSGREVVKRRVTVLKRTARVVSGGHARIVGRLVNRDGQGIPGADVRVMSASATSPEQLVAALQTDGNGRLRYRAAGTTSRTLRFVYAGSPLVLAADRAIEMSVPARSSLRVNRTRVLNGQAVEFSGRLTTQPAPAGGKLVELQARLTNRWQTFRTTRTDAAGRWAIPYRFKRTRGVQHFQFRARLPQEASYPFARGGSRVLTVRVRGL
jgi:5-hydroxyisourate hydrolase-like protein (transthyretin family)